MCEPDPFAAVRNAINTVQDATFSITERRCNEAIAAHLAANPGADPATLRGQCRYFRDCTRCFGVGFFTALEGGTFTVSECGCIEYVVVTNNPPRRELGDG